MIERIIQIEADSLDEARKSLYKDDLIVLQEFILCRGQVETIESIAGTVHEANAKAQARIPARAKIAPQKVKIAPKRLVLLVEGDNEEDAGKGKAELIESVSLHKKGRKGFFGFGKTRNLYKVVVSQQAVVEVGFRGKARLLAIVKDYLAKDLLECIQELRSRDAQWEEILQFLNPKRHDQINTSLNELLIPDLIDSHAALNIIESKCHKSEGANWEVPISEARQEASSARVQLWVELRDLDAELADVFMFYTSVDWYAKSQKEPTGIPMHVRTSYGRHFPGEQYRQTIPRYSTDNESFRLLEGRAKEFGAYDLWKQFLDEEGQHEATATLKQKCVAILKARKLQLKGR